MQSTSDEKGDDDKTVEATWSSVADRLASSTTNLNDNNQDLLDRETNLRVGAKSKSIFFLFLINGIATILIVVFYLISLESLLSMSLSIGLTVYSFYQIQDDTDFNGATMNWTLLTFTTVIPMSASIGMAFTRRESALTYIAALRSLFFSIYQAHASWDWGTWSAAGRKPSVDWLKHSDGILQDIMALSNDLTRYLTMPSTSRARHRVIPHWKKLANVGQDVGDELMNAVLTRVNRISLYCEILKFEGMPGNEAARIRQWEREIVLQIEALQVIKEYRTPQALRSLCRLFCVLLPAYYAPFYAQLAVDLNSLTLAIGICILTSFALTALYESLTQMEDPFVASLTLDGIDVARELQHLQYKRLLSQRRAIFFCQANPMVDGVSSIYSEVDKQYHLRIFDHE